MFDLAGSQTFENVSKWIEEAEENTKQNTFVLLIGNKADLPNREVSQSKIDDFLARFLKPMLYMETSALTGQNVDQAFHQLVESTHV